MVENLDDRTELAVYQVNEALKDAEQRLDSLENKREFRLSKRQSQLWALGFAFYTAPEILDYFEVRNYLGATIPITLVITFLMYAFAFVFFALSLLKSIQ